MKETKLEISKKYYGFKLEKKEVVNEIDGMGYVFVHEKSGINVIILENDDPHMTFSIGFNTPPENNKGIPHILEHTVCCASKKYPLKETLSALEQGSICSVINACTYPDMTMYYAGSPSEKDLLGISEVFIDMVFNPLIYSSSQYFRQEGWCYEVDEDNNINYGGVVYNEMEGIYAEATTYLEREIYSSLFGGTAYEYDAGGIPEDIVELEEEELLSFHKKYYRGDNCIIVFYGTGSTLNKLKYLEENSLNKLFINKKNGSNNMQNIAYYAEENRKGKNQKDLDGIENYRDFITIKNVPYPLEAEDEKYLINISFLVDSYINAEHRLAFEILEHMLLKSAASPLLKSLITDGNLGLSLSEGGYDTSANQAVFSITLNGAGRDVAEEFKEIVYEQLESMVKYGMPQELLEASINMLQFSLKEKDGGYEPIGIQYSEMMMKNKFYGAEPLAALSYIDSLNKICSMKDKGYFEELIDKYLLQNIDTVLITLEPSAKMANKKSLKKHNNLMNIKRNITDVEFEKMLGVQNELKKLQLIENNYNQLKNLPSVNKTDLPNNLNKLNIKHTKIKDCKVVIETENTKDITYINLLFNTRVIEQKDIQYLGIIANLFTYVGTNNKSYVQIENEINTYTGGINSSINAYYDENINEYTPIFKISSKILDKNVSLWKELMIDLLNQTIFEEKNKIKELIGNTLYQMEKSFKAAPEYHSVQNVYMYISEEGVYINEVGGMNFYRFLRDIYEKFEINYGHLKVKLAEVMFKIFDSNNLTISIVTSKDNEKMICNHVKDIVVKLNNQKRKKHSYNFKVPMVNEAFIVEQESQAIAAGINFRKYNIEYSGDMEVVMNILESGYLWDRIRLQGGAYGSEILLSKEGYLVISTYCDPNIRRTLDVFDLIQEYLLEINMENEQFERYVVSTLGAFLIPMSMERRSERLAYLATTNTSLDKRNTTYHEIMNSDVSILKKSTKLFEIFKKNKIYSVMGNKQSIYDDKDLFNKIYKKI